ncbi:MAG: nucleotide exchange factor GrpE [archaeon]|nr:nucleotide exchange factor GrpE [archaeon]
MPENKEEKKTSRIKYEDVVNSYKEVLDGYQTLKDINKEQSEKMAAMETSMKSMSDILATVVETLRAGTGPSKEELADTIVERIGMIPDKDGDAMKNVTERLDSVDRALKANGESIERMGRSMENLSEPTADNTVALDDISGMIDRIEDSVRSNSDRITEMCGAVKSIPAPNNVPKEIEGLPYRMDHLSDKVEEIIGLLSVEEPGPAGDPVVYDDFDENPDLMTSREQFDRYLEIIERKCSDLVNNNFTNLVSQITAMRSEFDKTVKDLEKNRDHIDAGTVLDALSTFTVDLDNMLCDASVESYSCRIGDRFDSTSQKMIKITMTDDPGKNGTVCESLAEGYRYGKRIMVKEQVNVFKYEVNEGGME